MKLTFSTAACRRWLLLVALSALPAFAQAGYFQWDVVTLPASSGASCGNGTPYRFFVNRTPFTRNTTVLYEGGGACWDQAACEGQGPLHAANPNGIPTDYMQRLDTQAVFGLVTPFSARLDPFQAAPTQSWNMVFLPYCTGDVHTGSAMRIYSDSNPAAPRVQFFRGQANVRAAAAWLRANLGKPNDLLITGFSAGGVGASATYSLMRDALAPTGRSQLLADSGPLMPAPRSATPAQAPSLLLHNTIRDAWGLDTPAGLVTSFAGLAGFDVNDMGSIVPALAVRYPKDRFGYLLFQQDATFSGFSYAKFYPEIAVAAVTDPALYAKLLNERWRYDIGKFRTVLDGQANIGYHMAFFRPFNNSHCLTIVDWSGTGIEEVGLPTIAPFVDNILARGPAPLRNYETDNTSDLTRPVSWVLALVTFFGLI
ncbi:pectin acetylesterase-family hydrolase [soil metagenome]